MNGNASLQINEAAAMNGNHSIQMIETQEYSSELLQTKEERTEDSNISRQSSSISRQDSSKGNAEDAAVTMQKTYRGYRTRRQLADCAVKIAEDYGWWNVLEGVILRKNSEVDLEHDDNRHRWIRVIRKAAKLGHGLSKDANARQLAFQHWLEAIDARHRYGHNLHKYYHEWYHSRTKETFFYWLDVGEGRQVSLKDYDRVKLNKEQIVYLGPNQRKEFEVTIENGRWFYTRCGELLDTVKGDKWIFVMSTFGKIYVGQKKKGKFQHSSFLAGGAAKAAGRLIALNGTLKLIEPHSGHYRPTEKDFSSFLEELQNRGVDLTQVQIGHIQHIKRSKSSKGSTNDLSNGTSLTSIASAAEALMPTSFDLEYSMEDVTYEPVDGVNSDEQQTEQGKFKKQLSFSWSARLSSLSVIPQDIRTKALEDVTTPTPRGEQTHIPCDSEQSMLGA